MANVALVDIPVLPEELEPVVARRFAAQDRISMLFNVPKGRQRHRKQFSRGLLVLAAYLKHMRGHNVRYVTHEELTAEACHDAIRESDLVGIAGNNSAYFNVVKNTARLIKKQRSDVPVVLGGYHATAMNARVLDECQAIDYVVHGEGEIPLLGLADGTPPDQIAGLTWREGEAVISSPAPMPVLQADLQIPDYSILPGDLNDYNFNIQTVRGCQYRCTFCANGYFWGTSRATPLPQILDELSYLDSHLHNGTLVHFSDNILSADRGRAIRLLDGIIERNIRLVFSCDLKANHVDEILVRKLRDAGVVKISLGFEDADDMVLGRCNKGLLFQDNVNAAKVIKKHSSILVEAYWIVGLPGSDHGSMRLNLDRIAYILRHGIVDVISSSLAFTPLPGTPMFDDCRRFGITILTRDWDRYLRNYSCPVYELDTLTRKELQSYFFRYEELILREYEARLNALKSTA
jgi:anaerobic magnesium-protoporphyrin IX monomethyl ester cyclase